jgi:hypothetical protein
MEGDEKRRLRIVVRILVARHLKGTDDLFETRSSPRTESLVALPESRSKEAPRADD